MGTKETGIMAALWGRVLPAGRAPLWLVPLLALAILAPTAATASVSQDIARIREDIAVLKAAIDRTPSKDSFALLRDNQGDLLTQLQELLGQVQSLAGRFEESRYYQEKFFTRTTDDLEDLKRKVDSTPPASGLTRAEAEALINRVAALEAALAALKTVGVPDAPAQASAAIANTTASVPDTPGVDVKLTPEGEYKAAKAVYDEGRYPEARKMLRSFLMKNPNHKLAGNAQFWMAETYYGERDFDDAILAYEDLLQAYKDHDKVPAALLKQAYAFEQMGDRAAARGILNELIQKYPNAVQAASARDKLKALEREVQGPGKN